MAWGIISKRTGVAILYAESIDEADEQLDFIARQWGEATARHFRIAAATEGGRADHLSSCPLSALKIGGENERRRAKRQGKKRSAA